MELKNIYREKALVDNRNEYKHRKTWTYMFRQMWTFAVDDTKINLKSDKEKIDPIFKFLYRIKKKSIQFLNFKIGSRKSRSNFFILK